MPPAGAADHGGMQEIMRLADADERSLSARFDAALALLGGEPVVRRFTLWCATRPPVHHAVVRAEAVSGSRAAR